MSMEAMGGELFARSRANNGETASRAEDHELTQRLRDKVVFPHVEAGMALYKEEYPKDAENIEIVQDLLDSFMERSFENVKIFESKELGASFPYTSVSVAEIAKLLYTKYQGGLYPLTQPEAGANIETQEEDPKSVREFNFTSVFTAVDGNPFTFSEENIRKILKYLPAALEDLSQGKVPRDYKTYIVGFPTNVLGDMSPEFWEKMQEDPFGQVGELYADFVKNEIESEKEKGKDIERIRLAGISMGAGIAVKTGESLQQNGVTVQDYAKADAEQKPFLSIRADAPVALHNTDHKALKLAAGFVAFTFDRLRTDEYLRKVALDAPVYMPKIHSLLVSERGFKLNESPDQLKMKTAGARLLVKELMKTDFEVSKDLKFTKVINTVDLTMLDRDFNREAAEHKKEHKGSIGESFVPDEENPNVRTSALYSTHFLPSYRRHDFTRLNKVASYLQMLKKQRVRR